MLSKEIKIELARELAFFRNKVCYTQRVRLTTIPFIEVFELFNLNKKTDNFPCITFGKQLVLKIIDELLDTD